MGRNTHPSDRSGGSISGRDAGIGKSNSARNSSKKSTSSSKSSSSSSSKSYSTLSGGVALGENDPTNKNYRSDRYNSDGSMTEQYRSELAADENDRIMSEGGWGAGYYDRDSGKTYKGDSDYWSTKTLSASSFDDDPYEEYQAALERQREEQAEALRKQVENAVSELEAQKPVLQQQYEDSAAQAYIQNMLAKKNLKQQLAAQGIGGGMSESSNVRLDAQYGNSLNELQNAYNQGVNQIDRDILTTRNNGDITIAQNAAQYEQQLAQTILQQQQAQQAYEQQLAQIQLQSQLEAEAQERQHQNNLAYLAAQQGYKNSNSASSAGKVGTVDAEELGSVKSLIWNGKLDYQTLLNNYDSLAEYLGEDGAKEALGNAAVADTNRITIPGWNINSYQTLK